MGRVEPGRPLTGDLVLLDPSEVRLWRERGGLPRLQLGDRVCYARVRAVWAFPFTDRDHYVSFIDWNGKEIGLIERLADLKGESRRIAMEELRRRYFTPVITRINRVRTLFGSVSFDVETDRGPRTFDVKGRRSNIVAIGRDRYLFTDMDGNRYEIRDVTELDPASYKRIEGLI
jgi:hypothetical protein